MKYELYKTKYECLTLETTNANLPDTKIPTIIQYLRETANILSKKYHSTVVKEPVYEPVEDKPVSKTDKLIEKIEKLSKLEKFKEEAVKAYKANDLKALGSILEESTALLLNQEFMDLGFAGERNIEVTGLDKLPIVSKLAELSSNYEKIKSKEQLIKNSNLSDEKKTEGLFLVKLAIQELVVLKEKYLSELESE